MEKLSTLNLREEFPILGRKIHGKPLVYFDSAATSQKPKAVIDSITDFYSNTNANVHRGAYLLSQEATTQYEGVRKKVCKFLGTSKEKEIIFTSGTTGAINLVASTLGEESVNEGDTIVVTRMEHHSNFVPWQSLAKRKKANFKIVELRTDGTLDLDSLSLALSGRPKILAITMMSNVLGTLNPIREIASLAKEQGAVVLVDAAQAVAHTPVKIADLGPVDFVAFSAHKLYGPTGVGILWGKEKILNEMKPYQFGGDMILHVKDQDTEFNQLPWKFEAGTPNFADVFAFGAALDWIESKGFEQILAHEFEIGQYLYEKLSTVSGLKIYGPKMNVTRGSVFSFNLDKVHPHDLATFLDLEGISVRAGHHCAHPLLSTLGVPALTRASVSVFNTRDEVNFLVTNLERAKTYFGRF